MNKIPLLISKLLKATNATNRAEELKATKLYNEADIETALAKAKLYKDQRKKKKFKSS
jgi:hypothetical protein